MSKSTKVNENGFTPFDNGRCQSVLKSKRMGLHPFAKSKCKSLLKSTRIGLHPLLMVDVKVYYSQGKWG